MSTCKNSQALRNGRAKLVSEEALELAQIASKRDKNKLVHKQEVLRNIILKAGQARSWINTTGRLLQLETPETRRARDFADIYIRLIKEDEDEMDQDGDRVKTLHAVANLVRSIVTDAEIVCNKE